MTTYTNGITLTTIQVGQRCISSRGLGVVTAVEDDVVWVREFNGDARFYNIKNLTFEILNFEKVWTK